MTSTLKLSNTNQKHRCSDIPFNLFERDCQQGSLHHLTEESKTFLWHRFMIDALLHTPKTTQDVENVIAACRLVNEYDPKKPVGLNEQTINKFRLEYQCNEVLSWYTRASFFFDAFNKACRMKNSDAIVLFHSIVKDLDDQLKYEQSEQLHDRTLTLPLTLYRGQPEMSSAELKKISENIGGLISFHSFLSTTSYCPAAASFACGPDPTVAALFQITVNEEEQGGRLQTFASIAKYSKFKDEKEVLFGVSSVFRIVSAEQDDCFWDIKLELTSWEDDPDVRKFINQAHRYLYQNSGKHLPFIAFQQWFSLDSLSYTRPLIELMKFGVVQLSQLFLHQAYQLEGRLKKLIDNVPDLLDLIGKSGTMIVHPNSTIIGPLFDILYDFLYSEKQENQVSFDVSDSISLLSFGGFLLLTGDLMKGIRYFEMLLKNPLINERMKVMIHGVLAASYAQTKQNDRALESCQTALAAFQLSGERTIPGWLPSFLASSHGSIDPADRQTHAMIGRLQPSINEEQSNNMLDEKVRLLYSGHIHFQQRNFRAALNRWEEAAEIESHIPSTAETVYNGAIYIQMAAAYFQLDNSADALKMIVRATRSLASFYPAGHRMFATLNFMRGYYLMHNDKPNEAIVWLKSALENPHFSESPEFCTVVLGLLTTVCIQSGDLDSAKTYGDQALKHGVTEMNAQISELLKSLPDFRTYAQFMGHNELRREIGKGLRKGQVLVSQAHLHHIRQLDLNDETTWTSERLIAVADHYRHQRNTERADFYYRQALDRTTASDYQSMWKVYKKIMRMEHRNEDLRDCFSLEYSKYDDCNPDHFEMIATLQTILYRVSLSQNEGEFAFDCLVSAGLIAIKSFVHRIQADPSSIFNLFDDFLSHNSIDTVIDILIKLMELYSSEWQVPVRSFLSTYLNMDELARLVHHTTVDLLIEQMESKYEQYSSATKFFQFLEGLLQFLRRTVGPTEITTLAFRDQVLKFLHHCQDETSPLFHLMKALESLSLSTIENFYAHLDQFRYQVLTFQRYQQLKERIVLSFTQFDEKQLRAYLESIAPAV